jgi:hypothetical protein
MTPLDDGDSGQAKNLNTGKCRDMLAFHDIANVLVVKVLAVYRQQQRRQQQQHSDSLATVLLVTL